MPEPEALHGLRVVATPGSIDSITGATVLLRVAADEAIAIGLTDLQLGDPFAIVEAESGFVGWWVTADEAHTLVGPRAEWDLPRARPGSSQLAQGLVAGVPMKVWFGDPTDDDRALIVVSRSLAHEAHDRLFGAGA